MEHPSADSPDFAISADQAHFSPFSLTRNRGSLCSFISDSIRNGQVGADSLIEASTIGSSSGVIRAEFLMTRTPQDFGRDSSTSTGPAVARRAPTRSRASPGPRSRNLPTPIHSATAKEPENNESPARNHEANNGPNTRSKKRHANEHVSGAESVPTQRKRSRSKPAALKKPPPAPVPNLEDEEKKPSAEENSSCCICLCEVLPDELSLINGCDHRFCFECIEKWAERENTCPLCKMRFTKIDRVCKRRKKGTRNTKKVKQRDQRSDLVPGAALEGLLGKAFVNSRQLSECQ